MRNPDTTDVSSPRLLAFLVGLVGATFVVVIESIVLIPFLAFGALDTKSAAFIFLGTALWGFSVCFLYSLLRQCQVAQKKMTHMVRRMEKVETKPMIDEKVEATIETVIADASPIGEFIRIKGTSKRVRLTDGVTRGMLAELAEAGLEAVSQRALDAAGVVTRDPSVTMNAGVLIAWLDRNGFIKPIGNSRYEFTLLGKALLETVEDFSSTPPPTTTLEQL